MTVVGLAQKPIIYLISGQGSDERIFQEITWDSSAFDIQYLPFLIPLRGEKMPEYAKRMTLGIDSTRQFYLVGVSLGGMICTEMADILTPEKVILLSSAKCRKELPFGYKIQRYIPLYAFLPGTVVKIGARIAQPIFEPDRKSHKAVYVSMLKAKDKTFMSRSIRMIINWQRTEYSTNIIHIHGNNDHTLPIRRIDVDRVIEGASHMMTLNRAQEISDVLKELLSTD